MLLNTTKEKTIEEINEELKLKKITHPFDDDLLNLKPFAETISNIVVSTKDPFVFSINSPYGTGKTFFLRRLHCLLEQKGCICVSYNAWESDFYDNPLIALISELISQLELKSKDLDERLKLIKEKYNETPYKIVSEKYYLNKNYNKYLTYYDNHPYT